MKSFAIIAFLPLAFAFNKRQAGTPPSCAVGCLADVSLNPAPCGGSDFVCLCTNVDIQAKITTCLTSSCAPDQIAVAATYLQGVCTSAGASVTVPSALGGSAVASASSAVASASVIASSGAASASSAAASVSGSASSALASISASGSSISAAVSASKSSAASSASSSSGAQPTGVVAGLAAIGFGAAAGVLGMM